jgi:hypothetical protein
MWSMSVSGRIEKRQSWGGPWSPKWSQRLPALIALRTRGNICEGGEPVVKRKIGRPVVPGSINSQKPWEAEGVSRASWYEGRKKSKGEV